MPAGFGMPSKKMDEQKPECSMVFPLNRSALLTKLAIFQLQTDTFLTSLLSRKGRFLLSWNTKKNPTLDTVFHIYTPSERT